jgi:hypothetical protein
MMADEKIVQVLLSLGLDRASTQKAIGEFGKYQKALRELEKEAATLKKSIAEATKTGQNVSALTTELKTVEKAMEAVQQKANRAFGGMNQDIEKAAFNLRDMGEKLNQVGMAVGNAGRAITSPILGGMSAYLQNANPMDSTARRWATAQKEIQASYERLGAVAAESLLPAIEAAADLVENIADLVEKNPELVKAALALGGGLQVVGGGLQMAGNLAMLTGSLQKLGLGGAGAAIKGGLGAAGKAAGGFLAGTGGAILGGVGLGLGGYEALARSQAGQKAGLANLGQYASVAAYGAGSLFGEETGQKWFQAMGELTGVIEKQTAVEQKKTGSAATPETLQLYADYQAAVDERKAAEQQHEQERTDLVNEQGQQRAALEAKYEQSRTDLIAQFASQTFKASADFAKNEARTERDYYAQRQQTAQKFGVETARMEADHQKEMRRMQQEHNQRSADLVASRDALGLVKEQRDYETERRRAEQDYSIQAERRHADYAAQLREMEASFAQQRARRMQDFSEQQAERAADQKNRLAQLEKQRQLEVAEFDKNAQERLDALAENQRQEMELLRKTETARQQLLTAVAVRGLSQTQYQAEQLFQKFDQRFNQWLNGQRGAGWQSASGGGSMGSSIIKGYAAGGYVNQPGAYNLAERGHEYVLNNRTTQAAERLMGQKLTEQNLLQSLAGRGGSTVNLSFPGGLVTMNMLSDLLRQNNAQVGNQLASALEI